MWNRLSPSVYALQCLIGEVVYIFIINHNGGLYRGIEGVGMAHDIKSHEKKS